MRQDLSKTKGDVSLITKDSHSTEVLRFVFEAAFFDCAVDSDGDLIVCSDYRIIAKSNAFFVQLIAVFPARKGASWLTILESINKMNLELSAPRGYALTDTFDHALVLDYCVTIGEGLTPKTLVESLRFFESCIRKAVTFYDGLLR